MAQDPNAPVAADPSKQSSVKFHTGISMWQLGFGTYMLTGQSGLKAIEHALKIGYRHLDTAIFYDNEEIVGQAIKNCKIARKELFVTSKLWGDAHGKQKAIGAVNSSLKLLDLDYIDLYLIHSPIGGKNIETYQALVDLQKQDKIKSVGMFAFFSKCFFICILLYLLCIRFCVQTCFSCICIDNIRHNVCSTNFTLFGFFFRCE